MTVLLTAAQMRAIEAAALASGEVTGLELMERAGRGVVEAIFEEWPELAATSHRAVVLCGPGGNGGDGFVVARLLRAWGWQVEVFLYGTPERMPPDARVNYERWVGMGEVGALEALNTEIDRHPGLTFDVVVDALFGIGLSRHLPGVVAEVFCNLFRGYLDGRVVSVDVPSGLCSDSGRPIVPVAFEKPRWAAVEGFIAEAMLTVTFHRFKWGHYLTDGPRHCGKLVVKELGLDQNIGHGTLSLSDAPFFKIGKQVLGHKYTHGHALILSGLPGHGGAARLSARGALRIGAGLVTVACPPDAVPENAARLDAIMLRPVADGAGLAEVLADERINVLCLGPGLGLDARAVGLVATALGVSHGGPPPPAPPHGEEGRRSDRGVPAGGQELLLPLVGRKEGRGTRGALVLDADALTILSQHPALFAALHPNCILTPHAGEFARLFPDIAAKLAAPATEGPAYSKVDATREAAARAGCVVLFKGADTVIADPSGRCAINAAHYDRAAPWLATAGSGDVLAGFITGLLARGFAPFDAACTAAWLHVECARSFGPGLIAEDLPEELPKVLRALGL